MVQYVRDTQKVCASRRQAKKFNDWTQGNQNVLKYALAAGNVGAVSINGIFLLTFIGFLVGINLTATIYINQRVILHCSMKIK